MSLKLYALLLEDVQKDAELLKEILIDQGFDLEMDVVETKPDYVSNLKRHNYDIIFADFTLPNFNGQAALDLAKRICPNIPFICISGTIGEDRAVELLKQGATDYVLKDRMERLAFATKRALDAAAQLNKFRQTEIELQTNRQLLQTIINNALDAIYIKDQKGRYLLLNEASEKAIGKTAAEIIGKDDTHFFPASQVQMIQEIDKKVLETGLPLTIEESVTLVDNNIHIFNVIKCPMFDDSGKVSGLFGIARDITERIKTEKELHETQEQYRLLFSSSIDAILLTTPDGRIFSANPSACKIFGYTEEEICSIGRNGIVDTSDPRLYAALDERARTGHFSGELALVRKDGSKFTAEISTAIFKDKDGNDKTSMIIRDVSERKNAEKALYQSMERYKTLTDISPVGIFHTDPKGQTTFVNNKWMQISGLSYNEGLGEEWLKAVHPDDKEKLQQVWHEANSKKTPSFYDYRFVRPDGTIAWVMGQAIPEKDEKNENLGYIGTITDITERKIIEEQLIIAKEKAEESDQLKTAFLTNMSHEIRTPMNAILGFSQFLTDENISIGDRRTYSDYIRVNGESLVKIIDDIIDISKIQSKQLTIRPISFDLHIILHELEGYYKEIILQKKEKIIQLAFQFPVLDTGVFYMNTDETRLKQILNNLISNAIKYTQKGQITVGYEIKENTVHFFVQDTGAGIPDKIKPHIFERFVQYSKQYIARQEGTGLGLSISKELVCMLGGELKFDSVEGKGSTFYFDLPLVHASKTSIKSSKKPNTISIIDLSNYSILIADDEESNYVLTKRMLDDTKVKTEWAYNGKIAVEMATQKKYDLILMDIKMPVMDGIEATQILKKNDANVTIIIQTAFAMSQTRDNAISAGCDDFIVKPISIDNFLELVGKHLTNTKKG